MNVYSRIQTSGNNSTFHFDVATSPRRAQGLVLFDDLERQMVEFTARNDTLVEEVAKNYVMPDYSSVREILSEYKILPEILVDGVPYLKRFFGADSIFTIRTSVDTSGTAMLYAVVLWPGELAAVREAVEQFDSTWWIARSGQVSGHLVFTYELI
jgi:hypothetical protein